MHLFAQTLAHSFMFHYDFLGCFADLRLDVAKSPHVKVTWKRGRAR